MQSAKQPDDAIVRELLGQRSGRTRVRLIVQARRRQRVVDGKAKDTSYGQIPGHAHVVEVRTLREFRKLWRAITQVIEREEWRDVRRPAAASELPAAGPPVAGAGPEALTRQERERV